MLYFRSNLGGFSVTSYRLEATEEGDGVQAD